MVKFLKKRMKLTKTFPYIQLKSRFSPSLIIVKDLSQLCNTEAERLLYEQLQACSYYPTPHYRVNGIPINLALVPYKLALIDVHSCRNKERAAKILKRNNWNTIFYDPEQLSSSKAEANINFINLVVQHAPVHGIS